ncbi:hypothetical protein EKO04_009831 [Ascochyta lentis]|uniref:Uncharacterized protein n=1 Tax=Ascochyta lentis TaxID=205686 RepID=A0A8H7IVA2_9PLEO|nr:hypothetical protein EKO04_009831 [Ascochyta lentis]
MEYINSNVRKLGSLFSSPPPTSVLGKRKTHHNEDTDDSISEGATFQPFTGRPHAAVEPLGGGLSKRPQVDLHVDVSAAEEDDYYGCPVPQPAQSRVQRSTALTTRANVATLDAESVVLRARDAMKKPTTQVSQSDEQEIQDELDQQQRQEESDRRRLIAHKNRMQAAGGPKDGGVGALEDCRPASSTSRSKSPYKAQALPMDSLSPKEQWTTKPNQRAREFLQEHRHDVAAMLRDLQEPAYVCRDTEIRDGVWKMMNQIEDFAKEHFSFVVNDQSLLRPALESMEKEIVKIIGCVASGGPSGASGWEDMFLAAEKRQALVCAIIGNVLIEQVFQHLFFGGTEAQINEVAAIQYEYCHKDGFDRNNLYATKVRKFLTHSSSKTKQPTLHLPPNFTNHTTHITAALFTHLQPLITLSPTVHNNILPTLHNLTLTAALLSLQMRLDSHTAYYFAPVFKDQRFSHEEMECINEAAMVSTHPRGSGSGSGSGISRAEQERRAALSDEERHRMRGDEGLVQIVLLPALTAYRRGGWETASPTPSVAATMYGDGGEAKGVRERKLTKAWVYCRWGRQRVWKDGRPADEESVHGSRWSGGGFVEFFPGVRGVRDPAGEEVVVV